MAENAEIDDTKKGEEPAAVEGAEKDEAAEKDGEKDGEGAGSAVDDAEAAAGAEDAEPAPVKPRHTTLTLVVATVAALAVGLLVGRFLPGDSGAIALSGKTALAESELDSTIATYTYQGETHDVTAREIVDQAGTQANDDGTYNVPSATDVVTFAQNQVILADAEERGLTASEDEVAQAAESMFGTSDFDSISETYGVSEATIANYATLTKLRDEVVSVTVPSQPEAPSSPEDGAEDTPTAEYASYVIGLAGDEWDGDAGTWARTDGPYYAALSGYEITADSATYAAAQAAYQVAYSSYSDAMTQFTEEWQAYTRNLLSNATIQVGSLVAS